LWSSSIPWLILALLALLTPGPVQAGPAAALPLTSLEVKIGQTRLVEIPLGVKRVSVGKDKVADVVVISPRQIYLVGKEVGTTTITLWDQQERVLGVLDVRVARDLSRLKEHLYQVLPLEPVEVREMEGSVVLSGRVSSQQAKDQAEALAKALMPRKDHKDTLSQGEDTKQWVTSVLEVGGNQQVNIKVRFAEVKRDLANRMKVNVGAINPLSNDFIFSTLGNYLVPAWDASTGKYIGNSNSTSSNFFGGFNVGGAQVRGALDIMKENKLAKILAEPTLTAISGQDSEFLAGGEFPVPVPQKDTVTVEFKKFGVQLGFKPEVLKNGAIRMTVSPEVSEMDFSIAVVIQGYTVPGLKTRKAKTQLEVKDGESFVIAGLFRDDISHQVQKVPLLGDIPILGALFRSTEFLNNQTELVIVVTPEVVRSGMAQPGPLPTDDLRVPSDDIELLLMGKMTEKPEAGEGLHRSLNELEGKFGHDPAF
jgi:pilus assembly protein CpaC